MAPIPDWFSRKFNLPFPLEFLPNLLTRVRGTPARLQDVLRPADPTLRARRPAPDKWSAQEHAGHLLDLESLWRARVRDYSNGAQELTVADLSNRKTHEANHNDASLEQILADFRAERHRLLTEVAVLNPSAFALALPHPRLRTPLTLADHLFFVAEHDDHHLAHVWALLHPTQSFG